MLITIEGIDGSGKSSLVASLQGQLADLDPLFTREPGSTWLGEQVRRAIAEEMDPVTEALLFAADHAAHIASVIKPGLNARRLIISDRYSDSRYAYQQVTLQGYIDEPLTWLHELHDGWTVVPDLTVLLTVPVDVAMERLSKNTTREHFERKEMLSSVQENYLAIAREEPERFIIVDALKSQEEIQRFVAAVIRDVVSRSRSRR